MMILFIGIRKTQYLDLKNDLALIRLKEAVKGVTPVEVVKQSSKVAEGDSVSVYGFPDNKLSPVLDSKVVGTTDFGSGIEGISYGGTKPGASGGGLYNDKGALIGVHQNGVVGSRSGGLVLSKSSWIGFVLILRVNQKILSMWKIKKWNLLRRIRIRI